MTARLCVTVPTELTGQSHPHLNTFTSSYKTLTNYVDEGRH
jgi:hypothetical protein